MEILAVFSPLVAFLIAGLLGKQITDKGCQFVTNAGMFIAAAASIYLFMDVAVGGNSYTTVLMQWMSSGDFDVKWALRIDTLAVVMMCVINIVSACVHLYSVGYMSHDPHKGRFMAYLSLFTFAMLMLVTADNLVQLFFGWEGVGLASYLLIGFWNQKDTANAAAVKAFLVNRVGDFGLALGIMTAFVIFGSVEFDVIFASAADYKDTVFNFVGFEIHALTLLCLLLFMGAVGKSAQLGLHTWLPDAMEGPTPVSALIHAATMVTAGVFLVARFSPVFEYAPIALMVVAIFGALTAFVAATIGMTQWDIKRVIAYSTMSQLGYMFFALGVSAYGAAMFHLMTHAFFKALLFLGAGSVIHAVSNEQDMRKMGGLWKKIPVTYAMMIIGGLALAGIGIPGVFGMAGYYSKDMVLEAAWADHTWFGEFAYWMGIAAAFMTAFYTWRLIILTFHGKPRASKKVMDHVHESPGVMITPLVVLATGAIFAGSVFYGGFVGSSHHHDDHKSPAVAHEEAVQDRAIEVLEHNPGIHLGGNHPNPEVLAHHEAIKAGTEKEPREWNKEDFWNGSLFVLPENDTVEKAHSVPKWVKYLPLVMGSIGILLGYLFYLLRPTWPAKFVKMFKPFHALAYNKYYFDQLYNAVFIQNALRLGRLFWIRGDQKTVDRFGPDGVAGLSQRIGAMFSRFQSGYIFQYAFVMMIAVIAIISWFIFRAQLVGGL